MSHAPIIKSISRSPEASKGAHHQGKINHKPINIKRTSFPDVGLLKFRMTQTKMNEANNRSFYGSMEIPQGMQQSLSVDKSDRNLQYLCLAKNNHDNIFNKRYELNAAVEKKQSEVQAKSKTIDLAEIKRQTMLYFKKKRNPEHASPSHKKGRKSEQFNEYFKKVVSNQRATYQLSKFYSEGKGLDIKNRVQFQKLQKFNLASLNRKIQQRQKDFSFCSTKVSFFDPPPVPPKHLPQIPVPRKAESLRISDKNQNKSEKLEKVSREIPQEFACSPWQSDNIQYDL